MDGEDLGEPVEVRVAVEYGEAAVLGCGGDQRVGGRYATVGVAAPSKLAECARRCVGDGAVVAQA